MNPSTCNNTSISQPSESMELIYAIHTKIDEIYSKLYCASCNTPEVLNDEGEVITSEIVYGLKSVLKRLKTLKDSIKI